MKRAALGALGLSYGLLLTWLCLYLFSHVESAPTKAVSAGCHEIDKCPVPWWVLPSMVAYFFGPSIAFMLLNAVSWKRWSISGWAWCFFALTLATIALYLSNLANR
ncbi:hypothetical protein AB4851_04260 [Burkholderia sp. 22PA0099]|uniref:hypothetical protein n=1 Tax=Burkholderia sp. 22PA0099 TaxID=3237372 RepID=UPI0039C19857